MAEDKRKGKIQDESASDAPEEGLLEHAVVPGFSPYTEETGFIYTPYHRIQESVAPGSWPGNGARSWSENFAEDSESTDFGSQTKSSFPGGDVSFSGRGPKGWRRADREIWEDACERMAQHPDLDASEIEIEVAEGILTMRGRVPTRKMKRLAEDVLEGITGLRDTRNEVWLSSTVEIKQDS